MVKHIVTFKLKGEPEVRLEVARKFKAALDALPEQIDVLRSIEVGINENPAKMEDVAVYAKHPAHVAAAAIIADHKENRACVDYNC